MNTTAEWITRRLPELIEEHGVVGAQVAVLADGEIADAAAGVLNNVTGEPVTTDSLFQIGSITKVWTATLVMQLVNEGLLDLDRPVRDVLPDFRLADERAAESITPRQLLCHTPGFEGDQWFDTGTDDDAIAKYVALLADAAQLAPPGELYSYCNAGYVLLGRIVEVVRGKPFLDVLRERLVTPLGLTNVAAHYDEYPRHRVAEGHLVKDGALRPTDKPMSGSDAPAGSAFATNARSLLTFARMHLETTAFDTMREEHVKQPDFGSGGWWGLGWALHDYGSAVGIGHNGSTMGFVSYLRVLPQHGVAVAILTNGGQERNLVREVFDHLLGELAGVRTPKPQFPPATPVPIDIGNVVGDYRSSAVNLHVTPGSDGRVLVRYEPRNWVAAELVSDDEARGAEYTGLREDALIAVEPEGGLHPVIVLCGRDDEDRVRWLHYGRAAARL